MGRQGKDGPWKFYKDKKLYREITYVKGREDFPSVTYHPDGTTVKTKMFRASEGMLRREERDKKGRLELSGQYSEKPRKKQGVWRHYSNGKPTLVETYDSSGRSIKRVRYVNGKPVN